MLEAFMRRPGELLTRDALLGLLWDHAYENRSNVVDVYVRYLREKIDRPYGRSLARDRARPRVPAGPGVRRPGVRLRVAGAFALAMALLLDRRRPRDPRRPARRDHRRDRRDARDAGDGGRAAARRPRPAAARAHRGASTTPGRRSRRSSARGRRSWSRRPGCRARRCSTPRGAARPPTASRCGCPASTSSPTRATRRSTPRRSRRPASEPFEDDRARVLARTVTAGGTQLRDHLGRDARGPRGRGPGARRACC